MRITLLLGTVTLLAACAQQPQQPVRSRDYFVSSENPYAGQPGVPQRLDGQQFRNQVRQQNGSVSQGADSRYEDTAVRSSMNIMQTFSRALATGN